MKPEKRPNGLRRRRNAKKGLSLPPSLRLLAKLVELANFATEERLAALEKSDDLQVDAKIFKAAAAILPVLAVRAPMTDILTLRRPGPTDALQRALLYRSGEDVLRAGRSLRQALRAVAESLKKPSTTPALRAHFGTPLLTIATAGTMIELVASRLFVQTDIVLHYLLHELDGLEAWRLAICDGCGDLYLRKKHGQRACRQDCPEWNALQMREYRSEKARARYAGNRRRNRKLGFRPQPVKSAQMLE